MTALRSHLGLCAGCTYARKVESARGSVFLRCALHDSDPRFPKYPRLPVTACPGFTPINDPESDEEARP